MLSIQEDVILKRLVEEHGPKNWSSIAANIEGRSSKSCRLRCGFAWRSWDSLLRPYVEMFPIWECFCPGVFDDDLWLTRFLICLIYFAWRLRSGKQNVLISFMDVFLLCQVGEPVEPVCSTGGVHWGGVWCMSRIISGVWECASSCQNAFDKTEILSAQLRLLLCSTFSFILC